MSKRILCVSYDPALLKTRQLILEEDGFEVTSAMSLLETLEKCQEGRFHLAIIGHSIPYKERQQLVKEFHNVCSAPVLALLRSNESQPDGADHILDSSLGPKALIATVRVILNDGEFPESNGQIPE